MALVDIWKTTPNHFDGKGIQQIVGWCGKLVDQGPTSTELREFLGYVPPDRLTEFAKSCLEESFTDSGLVLQDIANQIGRRLGFEVEDGLYRGVKGKIGFDGIWSAADGFKILVEIKTTDVYSIPLDTTAEYRKKLIAEGKLSEDASSILYIVGRNDTNALEAQIRGSKHAWDIRLISIEALLRLFGVKLELDDPKTLSKVRDILKPREYTRVDGIIELVFSATKDAAKEETPKDPGPAVKDEKKPTTPRVDFRSECAQRLQLHLGQTLVKQSSAVFATPEQSMAALVAISREYEWSGGTSYWFAFHRSQMETLEAFPEAYVCFGCGSQKNLLVFPLKDFAAQLDRLNKSESEDRCYWHVHIDQANGSWTIDPRAEFEDIDVSGYWLK